MNNNRKEKQLIELLLKLQNENYKLKQILKKNNIGFNDNENSSQEANSSEEYIVNQCGRVIERKLNIDDANYFYYLFWGRTDVYARRGRNGGYFPQCLNRWNNLCPIYCGKSKVCIKDCNSKKYAPLTKETVYKHLLGNKEDCSDVIGVYPLFDDNTCRFIVFDFDNHEKERKNNNEWLDEVKALRQICKDNDISCLVERSRSGNGAHVWILFSEPIKSSIARYFGLLLINKGMNEVNVKNFNYFDRIYPSQDSKDNLGNLIALPLQGRAVKQGNTVFVDENFNAYIDQWKYLKENAVKYSNVQISQFISTWQNDLILQEDGGLGYEDRVKPWRKNNKFDKDDVIGSMNIVLSDGIYVDSINLLARLKNQIRSLAAFDNPVYYKNKKLGLSNYKNASVIYLGEDLSGYIHLPRGTFDKFIEKINSAQIPYKLSCERNNGRNINVIFNGNLRLEQEKAVKEILNYNDGILEAATAFGKTVVCSYLIAKRKVSTLILLQSSTLLKQWLDELDKFLYIDEEMPTYKTKNGTVKKRKSLIGQLQANKSNLTGIVDVAMVGSLTNKDNIDEILDRYGMIIFDECHHAATDSAVNILKRVKSKYVYGVSATPYRSDRLEKINYMLLGPVRYSYSSKEKLSSQTINHYVLPRFTRVIDSYTSKNSINAAYALISNNKLRNEMIVEDIIKCIENNRTPLVLTKQKEQAKCLYDSIKQIITNVFIIYGDNSEKQNNEIIQNLRNISINEKYVLIATGQKIGEGFDLPRLDTLMLASPVSYEGRVEQYLGRLNRDYPSKKDVVVYDYIDYHMHYFSNMYFKRLKAYKHIGYMVINEVNDRPQAKSIYDSSNYYEAFEKDLLSANKSVCIASPCLSNNKVDNFISLIKPKQEQGVEVRIVCSNWSLNDFNNTSQLAYKLNSFGIETIIKDDMKSCFAVIDEQLVWYGSMNLLGKTDYYDSLMRFESDKIAEELLENLENN